MAANAETHKRASRRSGASDTKRTYGPHRQFVLPIASEDSPIEQRMLGFSESMDGEPDLDAAEEFDQQDDTADSTSKPGETTSGSRRSHKQG